jgi:hypothetical protein
MGRHWINPVVAKPLNLNISNVFLNENNPGFANLMSISLIDDSVKKKGQFLFGMAPTPAYRR